MQIYCMVVPALCLAMLPATKAGIAGPRNTPAHLNTLASINFAPGDVILAPATPYYWFFAISSRELISFRKQWLRRKAHIHLMDQQERRPSWGYSKASLLPPDPTKPHIGVKGIIVAQRMLDLKFNYDIFWCNWRHYVDYFVHGRVYSGWTKSGHWPMGVDCPLAGVIDNSVDVRSSDFKLKDGNGRLYELAPYTKDMEPRWSKSFSKSRSFNNY